MDERTSVTLCGRSLDRPGHVCAFFTSKDEQYDILVPYYREGIEQGEEVVNIVDEAMVHDHGARLEARGLAVAPSTASGQLRVLASEDTYTRGGHFAAESMYDLLQSALAAAHKKNRRVRTSGVMDWAFRGHAGSEELIEYEARVNVLVPIYDCTLLCVYDLAALSGAMLMDILVTHSFVIHRGELLENPYYRTPVEMLERMKAPLGPQESVATLA